MGHPDSDLVLPPNVHRWVNILSPQDGIARYTKRFFKKIPMEEHEVFTGLLPIKAHIGYWKNDIIATIIAQESLAALGYRLNHTAKR